MCELKKKKIYISSSICISTSSEYVVNTSNIMVHLENSLTKYGGASHIIAGDYNFEFKKNNIGYDLKDILSDYDWICCDDKISDCNINHTYKHESLNQQSWLDHFIVSSNLSSSVAHCSIVDSGENLSDHLSITCSVALPQLATLPPGLRNDASGKRQNKARWDKADLILYYMKSGTFLQSIVTPVALLRRATGCTCSQHKRIIDTYYNKIINMLKRSAVGAVPKMPFQCLKTFWNDDLLA